MWQPWDKQRQCRWQEMTTLVWSCQDRWASISSRQTTGCQGNPEPPLFFKFLFVPHLLALLGLRFLQHIMNGWLYNLEIIGWPCLFVQGAELLQSTPGYWLYGSCWFSHPLACLLGSQGVYLVSSSVSGAQEVLNKYLFNEDIESGRTSEIAFVEWISKFFLLKTKQTNKTTALPQKQTNKQ